MDTGYKWRFLKNYFKFFKNPAGLIVWRYEYAMAQNRATSLWNLGTSIIVFAIVWGMKNKSVEYQKYQNEYLYRLGAQNFKKDRSFEDKRDVHAA